MEENVNRREEYTYLRSILALQPGARILDAGCGLGEWTVYLRKQGFDAVGLNISQRTIERLQARFVDCTFVCGDIRHTNFAPGELTYVSHGGHLSILRMDWVIQWRKAIAS